MADPAGTGVAKGRGGQTKRGEARGSVDPDSRGSLWACLQPQQDRNQRPDTEQDPSHCRERCGPTAAHARQATPCHGTAPVSLKQAVGTNPGGPGTGLSGADRASGVPFDLQAESRSPYR